MIYRPATLATLYSPQGCRSRRTDGQPAALFKLSLAF